MVVLVLCCTLLLCLIGWRGWSSHERRSGEARQNAATLAQAAVRQADDTFMTVDLALLAVAREAETALDRDDFFGDLAEFLAERAATLPQVGGLFIFSEDGGWVANSLRNLPKDANNADRAYFIYHRDHPGSEIHIGRPLKSRVSGEWVLTLSRRLSRPDGSFAGVALATVPVSYLQSFYQQLDVGGGEIALLRDDGDTLARQPFMEAALGASQANFTLFRAYQARPVEGAARASSVLDGADRDYAYRRSDRYPLLVMAGVSRAAWFTPWKEDALLQGAAVLGLVLLAATGGAGYIRQRRRGLYLERRLRASERRLADLANNLPLLAMRLDAAHRVDFCNSAGRAWFALSPHQARRLHLAELVGGTLHEQWRPMLDRALAGERVEFECVALMAGRALDLRMVCMPDRAHDAAVQGVIVLGRDITEQKAGERRIHAIANNTPAQIAFIDTDLRFAYANGRGDAATGVDAGQMLGRTMEEAYGAAIYAMLEAHARTALAGERAAFEYSVEQGGERRVLHASYVPEHDGAGRVTGFYSLTNDVTAFKEAEQKLARLARFDALTGLPNRSYLTERLGEALQRSDRNGRVVALLRIEIDRFDELSDRLGHQASDTLLKELAARLSCSCRSTDMVARLGSGEFVVLMEGLAQADESHIVADKVIETIREPFLLEGALHELAATVGIALHQGDASGADALLRQAGSALRCARPAARQPA
jgi:diguanylate cyclase (GGDEF)-like protein/PAS domain S-box-containing protein